MISFIFFSSVINLILILLFYFLFMKGKDQGGSGAREQEEFTRRAGSLLKEFNRSATVNIDMLDEKLKDIKDTIKLADDRLLAFKNIGQKAPAKKMEQTPPAAGDDDEDEAPVADDPYREIYSMYENGSSFQEIVRASGRSPGEIELILGLKKIKSNRSKEAK